MNNNRGPVQARSLMDQNAGPSSPGPTNSTPPSGYYSTGNPFAVAPMDDRSDNTGDWRQNRYWDDRFTQNYGGSGMVPRLMTA